MAPTATRRTLRGSSVASAPFTLVGVVGTALTVASAGWIASRDGTPGGGAWATLAGAAALAVAGFVAARGCRVVVDGDTVRDQVAWYTVRRFPCASVTAIRVRAGPWRTYEVSFDDGTRHVVLGAGPVQFPANRMPGARERDLGAIDTMMGDLRT